MICRSLWAISPTRGGLFGTTSTIGVQIDGGLVAPFTNSGGVGSTASFATVHAAIYGNRGHDQH